jgi:hypothetical protein
VTVAIWPGFTSPTSDSLRGTTSCIELRSLRTANAELPEPELEGLEELAVALGPRAPPAAPVAPEDAEALEELEELDALVVPVAETTSPTCPCSETIVPLWGA